VRADGIGIRTWLLLVVTGWALLVWGLAIFGLGSRIQLLPAEADLASALPPAPPASRLASHSASEYGEATARPLFFSDRRPKPFSLQPGGEADRQDAFNYVLSSVLIAPGLRMAILQPPDGSDSIRFKLGEASDKLPGWRLTDLTPRSATFASSGETRVLDLRVFDGRNGQAPTAQPSVRPATGAAQATMPVPPPPPPPTPAPSQPPTRPAPAATASGQQPASPASADAAATPSPNEAQLQAIRERIEARRAKLRQEAQQAAKPKN
jgi:general secretion pathway protein N